MEHRAREAVIARFAATMSMLGASGGTMVRNLEICADAVDSRYVGAQIRSARAGIIDGASLSEALEKEPIFPSMLVRLVRVGESSGRLDDLMDFVAKHYRDECRHRSKELVATIEPLLTVVAGVSILFFALAVFLPYWNMIHAFRGPGG